MAVEETDTERVGDSCGHAVQKRLSQDVFRL